MPRSNRLASLLPIPQRSRAWAWLAPVLAALALAGVVLSLRPAQPARGKTAAAPLPGEPAPEQAAAEALALADPRVLAHTAGRRAEVFGVRAVGPHAPSSSADCAQSDCRQVEIYLYDQDAAVVAIVNLTAGTVSEVLYQPGVQPGVNQRVADLAAEIARNSPDVIAEAGFRPSRADLAPVAGGIPGTSCDHAHLCLAMTLDLGASLLWAVVDVTDERLVGVVRAAVPDDSASAPAEAAASTGDACPAGGSVARDGWQFDFVTTGSDGLRISNLTHWGVPVLTSAKLAEWHVDYGLSGFVDSIGCGGGGGGYTIQPFGETLVRTLPELECVPGFEVVQDFRMSNWGANCNYRYGQHYQFYADGRFRVVGAAYGRGCSSNGIYRPLMRLDLAVAGAADDSLAWWDGNGWQPQATEAWWPQTAPYSPDGYVWRVSDAAGRAYFVEPGQGQFDDGGRGDNAYLYVVQHDPAEGDSDLGDLGTCCHDDHLQGPEEYIDGEAIAGQDLVVWYVPQQQTTFGAGNNYCWTVTGGANPETYPCPAGPMFVPGFTAYFTHTQAAQPGETAFFTNTAVGAGPIDVAWDFGDGIGAASTPTATYQYAAEGIYTVTLTITDTLGSASYSDTVYIGLPPAAGFTSVVLPEPVNTLQFTNTSTGTAPLSFLWAFGDGLTSTLTSPSHSYLAAGAYTVTLTAANPLTSGANRQVVLAPTHRRWLPLLLHDGD